MGKLTIHRSPLFLLLIFSIPAITFAQAPREISLSGKWMVTWNDGTHGANTIDGFSRANPLSDTLSYIDVEVPMDLNKAMQKKGMFGDLNYGMNYLSARWVSQQYWQYYKFSKN